MDSCAKKRIVIVIPSDPTVRALLSSGALLELEANCDVTLIASPEVKERLPEKAVRLSLASLRSSANRRLDRLFWFHALYIYMRQHRIRDEDSFKVSSLSWFMRRVHQALALPGLRRLVEFVDGVYFRFDVEVLRELQRIQPELLIVPGWAMDTYSHMFLRTAHLLGIPSLMVISHWDYFTKKGNLRVKPSKIYVWGRDMLDTAVTLNGVPSDEVRIVGAPQFQKYLSAVPNKVEAKTALGLDVHKRWFLFPGAGLPYDELTTLKAISERLRALGREDIGIVYRPHPRSWERQYLEPVDPSRLWNVVVDDAKDPGRQSNDYYKTLVAAVDGSISPFSTMILEVGLCGGPALCLGFSDEVNAWDFSQVIGLEHIRPLLERGWVISCTRRGDIADCLDNLLSKLEDAGLSGKVREEVRNTVFNDSRTYAERLFLAIEEDFLTSHS